MSHSLIYQIAEEFVVLYSPDVDAVRHVLGKYAPFEREALPAGCTPILEVWGGQNVELTEAYSLKEEAEDAHVHSRLYANESGELLIDMNHQGHRVMASLSSDWHRLCLSTPLDNVAYRHLIDRLVMIAFSMVSSRIGVLKVHASVIELEGRALVFMGVSGTGKSTHSRLWLSHVPGATLLNDDEPIVRLMPDGVVRVYGCPWSGSTPCYRDAWAEVKAFVHLYQAPSNELRQLRTLDAFNSLFTSCAFVLSSEEIRIQIFNAVVDILIHVPVYRFDNRPELAAVELTRSLI